MIHALIAQLIDQKLIEVYKFIRGKIKNPNLLQDSCLFLHGITYNNVALLNINADLTWNISFNHLKIQGINDLNSLKINDAVKVFIEICNSGSLDK